MRLEEQFKSDIVVRLKEELALKNIHQVPKIEKIVLNMGVGDAIQNRAALEASVDQLSKVAGQKAVITKAKKSISNFKLREGMAIGCSVTLRGQRMYAFLERLVNIALPRVRDFRGISGKSFDGRGNYTLGVRDLAIFPEVDFGKLDKQRGLNICVVTTATTDAHAKALLTHLGFPFRKA
jgi:large subunit ribosomal protein L5